MRARVFIIFRVIALVIVLPALAVYFSPPSKVIAQCSPVDSGEIRVDRGLISANNQAPFSPKSAVSSVYCVSGSGAIIPDWALIKYKDLKTLYYDQAKTGLSKTRLTGNQNNISLSTPEGLYWVTSTSGNREATDNDLIINTNPATDKTGVIFVDGDLLINSAIMHPSNTTGLVFIVQGRILINRSVAQVDAFLISYGQKLGPTPATDTNAMPFCSAWDGSSRDLINCVDDATNPVRLTINGSVISLNTELPGRLAQAPQFVRQKSDATLQPAEIINYQPKYLVILKNIFSRDLKIWKEVQ